MKGPSKVVAKVEEHLLTSGEQLVGVVLDNSFSIETGGRTAAGGRYKGDKTAQRLAEQRGFDLDQRVACGVLALTDTRLLGAPWPIKGPELEFHAELPGPRLVYAESESWLASRTYVLVEFGDGRFTTLALQPKSFGLTAGKTKAGIDAIVAGFGDAAERVELA
jgi:hypothetical protein